ncbi:hypothetical protein [Nocardiopsis alba]|uniref:hypothetical protein n=1 Tax=Nocardiopsis alba TaxID=53437 RepID=UPI003D731279
MSEMARFILLRLLSNADDFEGATALKMWEDAREARGDAAPGKRAFLNAFNEMEAFGYLVRTKVREGSKWVTHVDVYDTPQNRPEERTEDASLGLPDIGKSEGGKPEPGKSESGQSSKRTTEKDVPRSTTSSSSPEVEDITHEATPTPKKKTTKPSESPEEIVVKRTGCTPDEARLVVDIIEAQGDGHGGRIRSLAWWITHREERTLAGDLAHVRRTRATPTATTCGDHQQAMPPHGCSLCAGEIKAGDPDDHARLRAHLAVVGADARPDLARLLGMPATPTSRTPNGYQPYRNPVDQDVYDESLL